MQSHSPDLDRDELARFARPAKRVHLETPDDRHTYGKMAGLQIDPAALAASAPNQYSCGRPIASRAYSGVAGAFGLSSSLATALAANPDGLTPAPRVPPSSPTKADALPASFDASASTFYQQAVAPAPPTSPSLELKGFAPPSSPQHADFSDLSTAIPSKREGSADLEDSEMRIRRGHPTSYEVEPDRIVVTSLDDTSSSEGDGSSQVGGSRTPEADTSTESNDFVINNELIEKLEAHSRAVLTGTSERDNAASTSKSTSNRSRRSGGRRSAGSSAGPSLGSLLSRRRGSAQSSPASSGYASPINAEDARGALILWKDPEEVLKSTSTVSSTSPLKKSDLASVPENATVPAVNFMTQPPVAFESGSNTPSNHFIPGMASLSSPSQHASESPLYAQQSSLSSSYFPEPSTMETHFGNAAMAPRSHHPDSPYANTYGAVAHTPFGQTYEQQPQQHKCGQAFGAPAQHANNLGAQPIDLSGHFGPAEEMDLDG